MMSDFLGGWGVKQIGTKSDKGVSRYSFFLNRTSHYSGILSVFLFSKNISQIFLTKIFF